MKTFVVGIDCATEPKKRGIAFGHCSNNVTTCEVSSYEIGLTDEEIASRVHQIFAGQATKVLLALDAPLGWPIALGNSLVIHMAGQSLPTSADMMFRRETDRFIKRTCNKQPLDVGADRIARTAHSALTLLATISGVIGIDIPLAWSPDFKGIAAIEVYPAATLRAYDLPDSGYKDKMGKADEAVRKKIIDELPPSLTLPNDRTLLLKNADALDATICVLAGIDFLSCQAHKPTDKTLAHKEGWIWVKETASVPTPVKF